MITINHLTPIEYALPELNITIKRTSLIQNKWRVLDNGLALSKDNQWDYVPQPSSREDNWIDAHTFDSLDDAIDAINTRCKLFMMR